MTTTIHRLAALGAALALLVSACGDDDAAPSTTTAPMTTTTAAPSTSTIAEPANETITVTAIDFAFVGLPEEVSAGTTLVLDNTSATEVHELVAIRLPDDETRTVLELTQAPDDLVALFSTVETVVIAPPEETGFPVVGTGALTSPGRYAIICAIPTGADPAEYMAAAAESEGGPPDVPGGPPHFVHGMIGEVVVTG